MTIRAGQKRFFGAAVIAISTLTGSPCFDCAFAAQPASSAIRLLWQYPTLPYQPLAIAEDKSGRPYLYVALKSGGLRILHNPGGRPPQTVASVPVRELSGLDATALAQAGSNLYVALGDFFAAQGSRAGLAIISVADPTAPKVLSSWVSQRRLTGGTGVLVEGRYAYLAAKREGVFVFDVADERNPQLVSAIHPDVNFPRRDPGKRQRPNARGLAIHGNLLFVAEDAGGLRVIDVADKQNPKEIAQYVNPEIKNKPQAYNNVILDWPLAYAAVDYCGMEILNVGDLQHIRQAGWWNPWRCESPSNIWFNSPGHTNQLAFDKQRRLIYLSAGDSELQVVDVSNPGRPALVAHYGEQRDSRGTWGIAIAPRALYLAYINAQIPFGGNWAGIRALSR